MKKRPKYIRIVGKGVDTKQLHIDFHIKRRYYPVMLWQGVLMTKIKWYQWPVALVIYLKVLISMYWQSIKK